MPAIGLLPLTFATSPACAVYEQLLSEQASVILEAVGETIEKKLDEKFDPVITKLDGIMKGVEALQQENTVGGEQLRRHEDQLQKHEAGIAILETEPA